MTFEKNFCPSPWIHMRINNSGTYEYCRWAYKSNENRVNFDNNIKKISPTEWFQNNLAPLRQQFLNGEFPDDCKDCRIMEQHNKISGRQRQLIKIGALPEHFSKSLLSSPLKTDFDYSDKNQGHTARTVSDWQIDLGNYCNSACVFCGPDSSSKLAAEFKKLKLIDQVPPPAWCDDPVLLDRFIQDLVNNKNLQYLHFIGGETVITPGFSRILSELIKVGLAKDITIGFTTNLTVWNQSVVDLLVQFHQVHLGMSVEALTPVNDYVRWPGKLDNIRELLDRWRLLAEQHQWLIQLRITPTCLSIPDITTVYEYAYAHRITVESCNFLYKPEFLRISVLPQDMRNTIQNKIKTWIDQHPIDPQSQILNIRNPNQAQAQVVQDAESYVNYLKNADDESYRLPDLVAYLKLLENNRGNCVLDYRPEYEKILRSAGY